MRRLSVLLAGLLPVVGLISVATPAVATPASAASTVTSAVASPAGGYNPIALARVFNGALTPAAVRTVAVGGHGGVAADAVAVEVNVTVRVPAKAGSLAVFPGTSAYNGIATVSFAAGVTEQRMITANLGSNGSLALRNNVAGANLNVILDVVGFYTGGSSTMPGSYHPIPTLRLATPTTTGTIRAGGSIDLVAGGRGSIPAHQVGLSVVANLTIPSPTTAGSLTVGGNGLGVKTPVNYRAGATHQEMVTIGLGTIGDDFIIGNHNATPVGVIVDIVGYFLPGSSDSTGGYNSIGADPPAAAAMNPKVTANLQLLPAQGSQSSGLPASGVWAVKLDVTVVKTPKAGSFMVSSPQEPYSAASTVSFPAGDVGSYHLTARISSYGQLTFTNNAAGGLILSVAVIGYYVYRSNPLRSSEPAVTAFPVRTTFDTISCVSTSFCVSAEPGGLATVFNGRSWTAPVQIPGQTTVRQVACASADVCFAVGNQIAEYDGTTWTPAFTDVGNFGAEAISCAGPTYCLASLARGYATWNGATWTLGSDTQVSVSSVSCPTATFCLGLGSSTRYQIFDGTSWGAPTELPGSTTPVGEAFVSCTSPTFCALVTDTKQTSTFDGSAWTPLVHPAYVTSHFVGLSCATATYCVAPEYGGVSARFDGTQFLGAANLQAGTPLAVSCPAVNQCVATTEVNSGSDLPGGSNEAAYSVSLVDRDDWGPRSGISNGYGAMTGLSCPSTTFCASVTIGGAAATSDGTTWTTPVSVDPKGGLTDVGCATSSLCLAIGTNGVWTYDGAEWTGPEQIDSGQKLTAISCSPTTCVAGDDAGQGFVYRSGSWSAAQSLHASPVSAVSCSADNSCLVLLQDGTTSRYNATGWQTKLFSSPVIGARTLSCASAIFCLATGILSEGEWNGAVWTTTEPETFATVACTGTNQCQGVGLLDQYLVAWDGRYRSSPTTVGNVFGRAVLSCPTATTCFYGDGARQVVRLTAPAG